MTLSTLPARMLLPKAMNLAFPQALFDHVDVRYTTTQNTGDRHLKQCLQVWIRSVLRVVKGCKSTALLKEMSVSGILTLQLSVRAVAWETARVLFGMLSGQQMSVFYCNILVCVAATAANRIPAGIERQAVRLSEA